MCEENKNNDTNTTTTNSSLHLVRAKMCDLTHVFPSDNNRIDENYLFGLNFLIQYLERLLSENYVYEDPSLRN